MRLRLIKLRLDACVTIAANIFAESVIGMLGNETSGWRECVLVFEVSMNLDGEDF